MAEIGTMSDSGITAVESTEHVNVLSVVCGRRELVVMCFQELCTLLYTEELKDEYIPNVVSQVDHHSFRNKTFSLIFTTLSQACEDAG